MAGRSYLATALAAGPNRNAALVTALIAAAVLLVGRIPLPPGSSVDLRSPDRLDGWVQTSARGFTAAGPGGRRIESSLATLAWNRPLPAHFELLLAVASEAPGTTLEVRIGDQVERIALNRRSGTTRLEITNPGGAREIVLTPAPADARVHLLHAAIR